MRTSGTSWLFGAALLLCTPWATAEEEAPGYPECTGKPPAKDVTAAQGAFRAGQVSFEEADYSRAILYWEDAYRRDCTADALLLYLARAYELSDQKLHAIKALETYLQRQPDSEQNESINRRLEKLRASVSEQEEAAAVIPDSSRPAPSQPAAASPTPAPQTPSHSERKTWPLYVAGGGGAVFLIGIATAASAKAKVEDYEQQCSGRAGCPSDDIAEKANDERSRIKTGNFLTGLGATVALGGVAYYFLQPLGPSRHRAGRTRALQARWAPAVGPGFTGLAVQGKF